MPSIDERIVEMNFENRVFEARVAQTMGTLNKLDSALKNMGGASGFARIEAQASKVTLQGPMSALDKLRARFSRSGVEASQGLNEIERAGNKVTLEGPNRAFDHLQSKMGQVGAGTTFTDIERAADRTTLSGLTNSLENVTAKFSVLSGAASVALGNIGAQAAMRGAAFAKSFAFEPIKQGMDEYQTNLNSIQTILANTQGQQVTGLANVQKYLGQLNTYSDKTIYNFSEMAKNIGTFTAAGVSLPKATESIKGIANLAAASGSSSQQASTAMYQLSQAIASGKVGLQDWNSVVNAGMGGALFQKALMRTASNMGTVEKGAVKIDKATGKATINGKSFRESIMAKPGQKSWLTSDVLTNTLQQFTGDLSKAQLKAQGFTDAQIKSIQATAKTAQDAATQVKTLPQVFDVAKETIGSGWAKTFQLIFGNFTQSKKTFTELSNFINNFINKTAKARNNLLQGFDKLGGRTKLIETLKDIFWALAPAIDRIGKAFREVFPATTPKGLLGLVQGIDNLAKAVWKFMAAHADQIGDIFKGVFSVFHIGWTVIKALVKAFGTLVGMAAQSSGGFLGLLASVGRFVRSIDVALTKSDSLNAFFQGMVRFLKAPLSILKGIAKAFMGLFDGVDAKDTEPVQAGLSTVGSALDKLKQHFAPLGRFIDGARTAFRKFTDILGKVKDVLGPLISHIGQSVSTFVDHVANMIKNADYDKVFAAINTALVGGIFLTLRKALTGGIGVDFGGGFFKKLSGAIDTFGGNVNDTMKTLNKTFGTLQSNLMAIQRNIMATALLKIGAALLMLAKGVETMAKVDPKRLGPAMTAVAIGLGQLVAAMVLMDRSLAGGKFMFARLSAMGTGLVLLAAGVRIMASAVAKFSTMNWDQLIRGLAGVGGSLIIMFGALKFMPAKAELILIGPALGSIGMGLFPIAAALRELGGLSWMELAKGLGSASYAIWGLSIAVKEFKDPKLLLALGPALFGIGVGLDMMAGAIRNFASINLIDMAKGLGGVVGTLLILSKTVTRLPKEGMIAQGAGLLVLSFGLRSLAGAVRAFGDMDLSTLAKGFAAIGLALIGLGYGLEGMAEALPGALALIAAAFGLNLLGTALGIMGHLAWSTILKGLGAFALTIAALSLTAPVAGPALVVLGAGLLAVGLGISGIGAGLYLIAQAISSVSADGAKGIGILITAITLFIASIPKMVISFIKGLVDILSGIAALAPQIVNSLVKIVEKLVEVIIRTAPRIAQAAIVLLKSFLDVVVASAPRLIRAGNKLLIAFLQGVYNNIGRVVTLGAGIIVRLLNALAKKAPDLIAGGLRALLAFLNGIAKNIGRVVASGANVVLNFLGGVTKKIPDLVAKAAHLIITFLGQIAKRLPDVIKSGVHVITQFLKGIGQSAKPIVDSAVNTVISWINALGNRRNVRRLATAGINALYNFLEGIAEAIKKGEAIQKMLKAGADIASAIIQGIINGLGWIARNTVGRAVKALFGLLPHWAKKLLGIESPSKVFHQIGENVMKGLVNGLVAGSPKVHIAMRDALATMVDETHDGAKIGAFLGHDFMDGLIGAVDQRSEAHKRIDDAFASLRDKISEQISKIRDRLSNDRQKMKDELAKDNPSQIIINQLYADISQNSALLRIASKASKDLIKDLQGEKRELLQQANMFDRVSARLEAAKQTLQDITQARDDAIKSYTDEFNTLPDIGGLLSDAMAEAQKTAEQKAEDAQKAAEDALAKSQINQVQLYEQAMEEKIKATQKYMDTLEQLRKLGLDDATYKRLLSEGLTDQDFASSLLQGGKRAVDDVNKLDAELLKTSTELAKQAASNLYDAGVAAAKGLVEGLKERKAEIQNEMRNIANDMANAIKWRLGIRSPSRVMAEVGRFTAQGVIEGLQMSSRSVADAAAGVGDTAASAMSGSLSHISDLLSSEIDPDLTITPVLDLTQVRKDAATLGSLTSDASIAASTSFGQASATSQEVSASKEAAAAAAVAGPTFSFEQNNYSPEALSDVEIYRQTKNQISQVKSALGLPGLK